MRKTTNIVVRRNTFHTYLETVRADRMFETVDSRRLLKNNYFFKHRVGGHVSNVIGVYPRFGQVYGNCLGGLVIGAVQTLYDHRLQRRPAIRIIPLLRRVHV